MDFSPAQPNMGDAMGIQKRSEQYPVAAQISRARPDANDAQSATLLLSAQKEALQPTGKERLQSNAEMRENILRLNARGWEIVLREQVKELDDYRANDLKRPKKSAAEMEKVINILFQQARLKLYDYGLIAKKDGISAITIGKMPIGDILGADKRELDQDRAELKARYEENLALLNEILKGPRPVLDLHRLTQADAEKVKRHLENQNH